MIKPVTIACLALAATTAFANPPARVVSHCAAPVQVAPTYHAQAYYPQYVPVHISPDYYYSTANYYAQQLQAEATAAKTVQLLADAIRLGQAFGAAQQPGPGLQLIQPQPTPAAKIQGTPVNPALAALVEQKCLACHTGPQASRGVNLDNLSAVPKTVRRSCVSAVCLEDMPKKGNPLIPDEIKLFKEWMKAAE